MLKVHVGYLEVNAVFNGEPMELLEKPILNGWIEQSHVQGGSVLSVV